MRWVTICFLNVLLFIGLFIFTRRIHTFCSTVKNSIMMLIGHRQRNASGREELLFNELILLLIYLLTYLFICFSRAAPVAYGGCQARGRIGAVDASLRQSHSNAGSEPRLRPTPQLSQCRILNPLSKARD